MVCFLIRLHLHVNPSQIKDKNGKDVVSLIDDLRQKMPLNIATIIQRMKLEEVRGGAAARFCQFVSRVGFAGRGCFKDRASLYFAHSPPLHTFRT